MSKNTGGNLFNFPPWGGPWGPLGPPMGAKNFGGRSGGRRGRPARAGGAAGRAGGVRFKARTSAVFFLVSELILDHILINFDILGSIFCYFSPGGAQWTPPGFPRGPMGSQWGPTFLTFLTFEKTPMGPPPRLHPTDWLREAIGFIT